MGKRHFKVVAKSKELAESLKCNADRLAKSKAYQVCVYGYFNTVTKVYTPNLLVLPLSTEDTHVRAFERHFYDFMVEDGKKFPDDLEIHYLGRWNLAKSRFCGLRTPVVKLKFKDMYDKMAKVLKKEEK